MLLRDAWWQGRTESELANTLAVNLYSDFRASQEQLEIKLEEHSRYQRRAEALLDFITNAPLGEEIEVELISILSAVLSPTNSPTTSALDLAISSGQINFIEDSELRNLLAAWRQLVADAAEEEILLESVTQTRLIPEISKQVRLGGTLNSESIERVVSSDMGSILFRPTAEIEGALGQRVFFGNFVVQGLAEIGEMQPAILKLLEDQISD